MKPITPIITSILSVVAVALCDDVPQLEATFTPKTVLMFSAQETLHYYI